jgi:dUTPase
MAKTIKFLKRRDVLSPSRSYEYDAGIDFYVPKFNVSFIKDLKEKNPDVFNPDLDSESSLHFSLSGTTSGTLTMENDKSQVQVKYDLSDDNDSIIKFDDEVGKNYFLLSPHSRILIPSGIHSRMQEPGRALIAANKSGVASKSGLIFGAQVVDYTYKGEIHINVINTSLKVVRIYEDMKLIQFLETPIFNSSIEIAEDDNTVPFRSRIVSFYEGLQDDRGTSGFGSSNKTK